MNYLLIRLIQLTRFVFYLALLILGSLFLVLIWIPLLSIRAIFTGSWGAVYSEWEFAKFFIQHVWGVLFKRSNASGVFILDVRQELENASVERLASG